MRRDLGEDLLGEFKIIFTALWGGGIHVHPAGFLVLWVGSGSREKVDMFREGNSDTALASCWNFLFLCSAFCREMLEKSADSAPFGLLTLPVGWNVWLPTQTCFPRVFCFVKRWRIG